MLQPVTVTEAGLKSRSPSPRKLQKNRSHRMSYMKDRPRTPPGASSSSRARNDSAKAYSPESLNGASRKSIRSSYSADSSVRSPHPPAPNSLRIHTKGALLTTGFAYHPGLFDLKVHPIMWEKFTNQVVDTARLSAAERAKVWAIGTAAAVTTSSPDSYHIGRNKSQRIQEEKVKEGLKDDSVDSLGDLLRQWNEGYFAERGLLARIELSEAAQNSPSQHSKIFQREAHWYMHKEDRERVRAERKFSIVITQMYEPEELVDEEQEPPRASDSIKRSLDQKSSQEKKSLDLTGFKPLPELPLGAHPLLDIMADFTSFDDVSEQQDELPPANQVAELEGDGKQVLLKDQALVAELPAVEQQRTVQEYRDLVSRPDSPVVEHQADVIAQSPREPQPYVQELPSTPSNSTLDRSSSDCQLVAEDETQPQAQPISVEQQGTENWPLPEDPLSNEGTQPEPKSTFVSEQESADVDVASEKRATRHSQYKLFPNAHTTERSASEDKITLVDSEQDVGSKPAILFETRQKTVPRPIASPSASFFLPLDIKAVGATLDFDPQVAVKDMATAH